MIALFVLLSGPPALLPPDPVLDKLTAGHPEVATLLKEHPQILTILHEPMWSDVVLHAPLLPGTPWQVHDLRRPQPLIVTPDPRACMSSAARPSDAVSIFDGTEKSGFKEDRPGLWRLEDGNLIASGTQADHLATRESFGDVQVHLEFATPNPPVGDWQFRGNSGIFMMGMYEIQILDSYRNPTYADGQSGALYGQVPPLVNASQPPGVWQCFDIVFSAPRFGAPGVAEPARVTLLYNGVLVQSHAAFMGPTRFAEIAAYKAHAAQLPFALQDHGDPGGRVRFRNIWARRLGLEERQNVAP
jgi:hypothetical protein